MRSIRRHPSLSAIFRQKFGAVMSITDTLLSGRVFAGYCTRGQEWQSVQTSPGLMHHDLLGFPHTVPVLWKPLRVTSAHERENMVSYTYPRLALCETGMGARDACVIFPRNSLHSHHILIIFGAIMLLLRSRVREENVLTYDEPAGPHVLRTNS